MKVIIAGGRDYEDYETLKAKCDYFLSNSKNIEVVSGRCSVGVHTFTADDGTKVYGADGLGERYAKEKGYAVSPYPADWDKLGKASGPIRNKQMAEYAESLIAFHDEKSRGTKNMIGLAAQHGLKIKIVTYKN